MQLSVACNLIPEGVRMRTGRWIISHRRSWMTVYVLCCNAHIKSHSNCLACMNQCSINCPSVICSPSMLFICYGETPLVNCGPRSNFLYIASPFYFTRTVYCICITIVLLPLDTLIPLFTTNRWDWQPHRNLGGKYLFELCAGFTLLLSEDTPTSCLAPLSGVSQS